MIADGKTYILCGRNTYNYFLGDFPGHKNYDRDVLVVCNEPEKENSVNQLLDCLLYTSIRLVFQLNILHRIESDILLW